MPRSAKATYVVKANINMDETISPHVRNFSMMSKTTVLTSKAGREYIRNNAIGSSKGCLSMPLLKLLKFRILSIDTGIHKSSNRIILPTQKVSYSTLNLITQ